LKSFPGLVGLESLGIQEGSPACEAAPERIRAVENAAYPPHLSEIRILDSQVCRALAEIGWYRLRCAGNPRSETKVHGTTSWTAIENV
jgi:hypothetical protein